MFDVYLLAAAENEFSAAYDWYETQQPQLGHKFYNEINHYLSLLEINPYQFPVKYAEELRSSSIRTFPFVIVYWIEETSQRVIVASIFHTSRSPKFL